jgi:chemotaxis protein histidine kinase CheA
MDFNSTMAHQFGGLVRGLLEDAGEIRGLHQWLTEDGCNQAPESGGEHGLRPWVALQRQDKVAVLIDDLLGDRALAVKRVGRHDRAPQ